MTGFELYKTIVTRKEGKLYLFKLINDSGFIDWLSVYRNIDNTDFIVESGAFSDLTKMENQIYTYLNRKFGIISIN
jgi:hypothetical protein